MRFPKQELDIDQYMQTIESLLNDKDCHLFIDTNIISQLYKLNDDARIDFFNWVSTVSNRFHIPNWTVHEYQKRYCSQKTKDYLDELDNKDLVKKLQNLSNFVRGYVSDSLLVGSTDYQGQKDKLFADLDEIADKFGKINNALTKRQNEHQLKVHTDILQNLQPYTMDTDIYSLMEDIDWSCDLRYSHLVPPGFEDIKKPENKFGDLIIWKEILNYCKNHNVTKAIWITRDGKPDMTYTPQKQLTGGHQASDSISIAHESLVYEFSLNTNSQEFYLINFLTLVKRISSSYQELAISFQIVTKPESTDILETTTLDNQQIEEETVLQPEENNAVHDNIPEIVYSNDALADAGFEEKCVDSFAKMMITDFGSHNWYKQNDAAKFLMKWKPAVNASTVSGRDMLFVLGRNVYQSADGTSNGAIQYIQNLKDYVREWNEIEKRSFIDGMLYEVFFDSHGNIRPKEFKTKYYDVILRQIDQLGLENAYHYINTSLFSNRDKRFTPEVRTDKQYTFKFDYSLDSHGSARTSKVIINGKDASETFSHSIAWTFATRDNLKSKLSIYYAIPAEKITIEGLGDDVNSITVIGQYVLAI